LIHSVPLPRLGILGAVCLVVSYFIVFQLFKWLICSAERYVTVVTVAFLKVCFLLNAT
jgi:hypothetical protein